MFKNNFYNIPANYQFIETLGNWIFKNYKHNFSDLKVFLPNQRLSRKLKEFFHNKTPNDANNIKIKAISNLDINDFCDYLPNDYCSSIIAEISTIKILSKTDAIFLIANEIINHEKFYNQNFCQNFCQRYKIAKSLYKIFEDIDIEQINVNEIAQIDDSNLAQHQQFGLEFFTKFYSQIKNLLLKNNLMFEAQFHNFVCDKFIDIINTQNISQNIVIAGSTGSILSSKKLIKAIKNYQNGAVVLYGSKAIKSSNNYPEIHPQYYLNEVINYLNDSNNNNHQDLILPTNIIDENFLMSPYSRENFCDLIFDNFNNHENLLQKKLIFSNNFLLDEVKQNIELIELNSIIDEAKIINDICLKHQETNSKIGIICNNQNLLQLLISTLNSYNIKHNNTLSISALNNDFINFLILIFELKFSSYNSHNLLSLIKNKFFKRAYNQKFIEEFEINIIREARLSHDINGLEHKVKNSQFAKFINDIYQNLPRDKSFQSLINAGEYFANKNIQSILSETLGGVEIYEFFSTLLTQNFVIENAEDLKIIFNDINFFEKKQIESSIDILSPIEARLLHYDLVIITSLNENDFPKIEDSGWIGAKIKKELKINKLQKKIGQNANDFSNYLNNPKVIITRSQSRLSSQNVESQFLTRLKTLCRIINIDLDKTFFYTQNLNKEISTERYFIKPPQAITSTEFLPQKYYITEISRLISNPYEIFVKKILKLEELKNIDYEASNAEFGSFVHKALEEYIKDPKINSTEKFLEIFEKFFIANTAKLIWYPRFQKFLINFLEDNQKFSNCQNITEQLITLDINNIKLTGKIDRITIDEENMIHIFDYKTGTKIPTKNEVLNGTEPQLLIYAYIIAQQVFKNHKFAELSYWKLNRSDGSKITTIIDNNTEIQSAIETTKTGLENLFNYFYRDLNNFTATNDKKRDKIPNISRLEEWIN